MTLPYALDLAGVAVFAVSGAQTAHASGAPVLLVVVMGVMSGTFGGLLRDVLTAEIPLILRPGRLYAPAAALGPVVWVALQAAGAVPGVGTVVGIAATVAMRVAAIVYRIRLPVFVIENTSDDDA